MPRDRATCGSVKLAGWPRTSMVPPSGSMAPLSILIRVLLPAPLSPTRQTTSPAATENDTPRTAATAP